MQKKLILPSIIIILLLFLVLFFILINQHNNKKTKNQTQNQNKTEFIQKVNKILDDQSVKKDIIEGEILIKFKNNNKDFNSNISNQLKDYKQITDKIFLYKTATADFEDFKDLVLEINNLENIDFAEPNYKISTSQSSNLTEKYINTNYNFYFNYPSRIKPCCGIAGPSSGEIENLITLGDVNSNTNSGAPFDGLAVHIVKINNEKTLSTYINDENLIWEGRKNSGEGFFSGGENTIKNITIDGQNAISIDGKGWDGFERIYIDLPQSFDILVFSIISDANGFEEKDSIISSINFNEPVNEVSFTKDPLFKYQKNLYNPNGLDTNTNEAWQIEGKNEVVVAVIDSGIKTDHPDIKNKLWINTDEIPDNNLDDDNNGYVDDINGYIQSEGSGHGTWVSSIIAAERNNNEGIAGICTICKIMLIDFQITPDEDGQNTSNLSQAIQSINYAVSNGAQVINASWVLARYSVLFEEVINEAYTKNIIVVAAAGNNNSDFSEEEVLGAYPAMYEKTISVGGIDYNLNKSQVSNYGTWVDVSSFSTEIVVANNYINYELIKPLPINYTNAAYFQPEFGGGTSFATPHITATIAMIISLNPNMSADDITRIITKEAIVPFSNTTQHYLGLGYLDTYKALKISTVRNVSQINISEPKKGELLNSNFDIKGTINDPLFGEYKLYLGKGLYPETYEEILISNQPVTDSVIISSFDVNNLSVGWNTIKIELYINESFADIPDKKTLVNTEYLRLRK